MPVVPPVLTRMLHRPTAPAPGRNRLSGQFSPASPSGANPAMTMSTSLMAAPASARASCTAARTRSGVAASWRRRYGVWPTPMTATSGGSGSGRLIGHLEVEVGDPALRLGVEAHPDPRLAQQLLRGGVQVVQRQALDVVQDRRAGAVEGDVADDGGRIGQATELRRQDGERLDPPGR